MSTFHALTRQLAKRQPEPAGQRLLRGLRREALAHTLALYQPRVRALEAGLAAGDAAAREQLTALAEAALGVFRARVREGAREHFVTWGLAAFDALWSAPTKPELMDNPALPEDERRRIVQALDRFNDALGSYELFWDALEPALAKQGPTRVLDLASGHGGFPLALARLGRQREFDLEVIGTDLRVEYLREGASIAAREQLPVAFRVQNAVDLATLAADPPDVITCTQALHHFSPGVVASMLDQAARIARRAVVFIDGCRSAMHALPVAAFGYGIVRSHGFTHDGVVSLRRFFAVEELQLLANMVPRGRQAEARFLRPGHVAVTLSTGGRSAR